MKHGIGRYVEEQVVSIEHHRQENLKVSHEVQRVRDVRGVDR